MLSRPNVAQQRSRLNLRLHGVGQVHAVINHSQFEVPDPGINGADERPAALFAELVAVSLLHAEQKREIHFEVLDAALAAAIGKMPGPSGKTVRRAVHG